jgi:hypothetical protein
MYLMYVDESGDTGFARGATSYFALSGIVIHESRWRDFVTVMKAFRQTLRASYGLPVRLEIHTSDFMRSPPMPGMAPHTRAAILRNLLDELAQFPDISITNVIVKKTGKQPTYDAFDNAWKILFQRFENTLKSGNFPGAHRGDHGLVFTDATNGTALSRLMRKMAVHNPIPNQMWAGPGYRLLSLSRVIEDPHGVDSKRSYFIQAADVCAYFLLQRYAPNTRTRRHNATRYFDRLLPVLNTKASRTNALGIVEL